MSLHSQSSKHTPHLCQFLQRMWSCRVGGSVRQYVPQVLPVMKVQGGQVRIVSHPYPRIHPRGANLFSFYRQTAAAAAATGSAASLAAASANAISTASGHTSYRKKVFQWSCKDRSHIARPFNINQDWLKQKEGIGP